MTAKDAAPNHYDQLGVKPTASPQEIRRAYRDMSKLYHPDTTQLEPEVATEKFQILNEAYATLSNPEKRLAYNYTIGISKVAVIQAPQYLNRPASERRFYEKNSAYLDPTDRPLSAGELFALFILGVTFVSCLILVFAIGWTKGDLVIDATSAPILGTAPESTIVPDSEILLKAPALAPPQDTKPNRSEKSSLLHSASNPDRHKESNLKNLPSIDMPTKII
ncbi:MAG: J domain-containing protein [Cyanobacteria bacterium P01_H01_bin.58]